MAKVLIAPGKYVQEAGAMRQIAEYTEPLGKKALCIISGSGRKRSEDVLAKSFADSEADVVYEIFNGECCNIEIDRIRQICTDQGIDVLIGIGGGKIHDTAKAVGHYEGLPVVIIPTIASTDAPCSALSVIYSEEGVFEKYLFLKRNPDVVLVDTNVVAKAPTRLLVAGMGDALATYFETKACADSNASTCAAGTQTLAAGALSELCYETLIEEGYLAKLACDSNSSTAAFEKVVEANTLLSGIGFESGGLAGAHAIHNGFTVLPECHHMYHGEKVAFGTLVQLVLEDVPIEEIEEVMEFCVTVGLPVTLEELGVTEFTEEKIRAVAEAACAEGESIHNMPFEVTAESVYGAIMVADKLGNDFKYNLCKH